MEVKVNFIIGQLSEEEILTLKDGFPIISKMILTPDDYKIFKYKAGDSIQVETGHGDRLWCTITDLEVVERDEHVIVIFTLTNEATVSDQR